MDNASGVYKNKKKFFGPIFLDRSGRAAALTWFPPPPQQKFC
jgi:hypothetical protein